ncbi:hypothetical protein GCK72_007829 [Caenorhabditis remanei]|uniref:RNase NYN domain-containing protein n=1 Tax=Caenorhabditis remanei TaxID=31234 RepID=A0A6A5HI92_CAERE|nr:hypothetical protein GCK72_007829 [Caenorhabditis remanei]KAF1767870.1 hypothetical protein GCK72_007829 [Caenorhabditis remanei]
MNVDNDNYGWESSLSMIANEQSRTAHPRHGGSIPVLLRPVFMNAVEVGYSYAHCDREKKLNVRGVTIALWHFICRGHQAIALLPYCFKNYAEKSTHYAELMMLYRLNLIEFTPGYGSEKYAEVNRIMVNRAAETGGCLVARSQMQGVTDNKSNLVDVVEQRLLMPTFNGDEIMFPIDGPLGRNGPSLQETLECEHGAPDWRMCSEHQLLLSDQRHWMEKLALLVPEKVIWTRMVQMINAGGSMDRQEYENDPPMPPSPPQLMEFRPPPLMAQAPPLFQPVLHQYQTPDYNHYQYDTHYSIPNPHQYHQYKRNFMAPPTTPRRHLNSHLMTSPHLNPHLNLNPYPPPHHHHHGGRNSSGTRLIIRYGDTEPRVVGASGKGGGASHGIQIPEIQNSHDDQMTNGVDSEIGTEPVEEELEESPTPSTELDESVARELHEQMIEETREEREKLEKETSEQKKKDEILAQLSQIFGYAKSHRVMSKHRNILKLPVLVEKCLVEPDEDGDGGEFEATSSESSSEDVNEDLIDFSDEQLQMEPTKEVVEPSNSEILELVDLIF